MEGNSNDHNLGMEVLTHRIETINNLHTMAVTKPLVIEETQFIRNPYIVELGSTNMNWFHGMSLEPNNVLIK